MLDKLSHDWLMKETDECNILAWCLKQERLGVISDGIREIAIQLVAIKLDIMRVKI